MVNSVVIAIPTYNRAASLLDTLSLLMSALTEMSKVSIYVVDNASTDHTSDVLVSMQKRFEDIGVGFRYRINPENIGLDGSILHIAQSVFSEQTFTWFLSDDDYLLPDGVRCFAERLISSTNKMELASFSTPLERDIQRNPYFRASFLPTVALRGVFQAPLSINGLIGYNYIHLAIINATVKNQGDIGISEIKVGVQMPNISSRFRFFDTMILGYSKCLRFHNHLVAPHVARAQGIERAEGNGGWALLDYASNEKLVEWSPTYSEAVKVVREFGFRAYRLLIMMFFLKIPRIFSRLLLKRKVDQYLRDVEFKRDFIDKYAGP